jgi:hypothetical protein
MWGAQSWTQATERPRNRCCRTTADGISCSRWLSWWQLVAEGAGCVWPQMAPRAEVARPTGVPVVLRRVDSVAPVVASAETSKVLVALSAWVVRLPKVVLPAQALSPAWAETRGTLGTREARLRGAFRPRCLTTAQTCSMALRAPSTLWQLATTLANAAALARRYRHPRPNVQPVTVWSLLPLARTPPEASPWTPRMSIGQLLETTRCLEVVER